MSEPSAFLLAQAIDCQPLTVTPDLPVIQAILLMSQAKASCVLVVERQVTANGWGKLLGIFTERDVVRVTANQADIQEVAIASVMTQQPLTLTQSDASNLLTVLNLFHQHQFRHLPVVDAAENLVGMITHQSIREVLKPVDWMQLRRVAEVMTAQVVCAPSNVSLLELTQLMAKDRVSCVVITESRGTVSAAGEGERVPPAPIPVGIVTERDIVQFRALEVDFAQIQAQMVMSSPLLPIHPQDSLLYAHELMEQHHIRRLVVMGSAGELVGIVTQTSLLRSLDPIETNASIAALQRLVEERTLQFWETFEGLQCEIQEHQDTEAALRLSQARLAGILDTADDAIISVDEGQQIQLFNQGAEKIFGYTAAEILGQSINLLLSDRLRALHQQYIQEFSQSADSARKMGKRSEIVGRRKDGTEFPAEASISKLEVGEGKLLTVILRDISDRKRTEEALRNQLARERIMGAIASRIRQSLELDRILNTTVAEVRQFLKADRVIIYRFNPDNSGLVTVESVSAEWTPLLGIAINDHCFAQEYVQLYQNGRIQATADIYNADLTPCHIELLAPFQVRANLVVPILRGVSSLEPEKPASPVLWGLLAVHQCSAPRHWQEWEIDLLKHLATQVAIAIQQAELYQQLVAVNQQLQQLASLDGLTQVANRRSFDEYLTQEWRRLAREQEPLSLILCDVDFFKLYNDTYGHLAGDTCLQQVSNAIREAVKRPADLVARYGGEEFAVILPNTPSIGAVRVAEGIRSKVSELKIEHSQSRTSPYITLSVGVASMIPFHQVLPDTLIALADKALYEAKAQGRDRIVLEELKYR